MGITEDEAHAADMHTERLIVETVSRLEELSTILRYRKAGIVFKGATELLKSERAAIVRRWD